VQLCVVECREVPPAYRETRTARMHSRVALFVLAGLCLEAGAYVPQRLPLLPPSARRAACRAPALRVAMQFQTTSSARDRQAEFAMPKSAPISSKRQPEGPLEDDPSLPMIEDIIRSLDARKVHSTNLLPL